MNETSRALLATDHRETGLVAVEPREEHDARFVEARRCGEDMSRQRYRRREDAIERRAIAARERGKRRGSGRRDGVEDAEERVRMSAVVAADQRGEVEVVARVHPNAGRKTAT